MTTRSSNLAAQSSLITGLILAGGQGRRVGMRDKGLIEFCGRPLIAHALERLAPQVDQVLISANRNFEAYASFGVKVVRDATNAFDGPAAGLEAGLSQARNALVLCVPCDAPRLPLDLAERLRRGMQAAQADIAVAKAGHQAYPVVCLVRRDVHSHLCAYLSAGGRKMDAWYATLKFVQVAFDDEADAFANINTVEDLQYWETAHE